ncbi:MULTISPECIES: ABC transporter permease [unclassified Microbacterium]|uniref:ABC transporter permease n=1 Tax=unclassified Microbacterium TaxID=2609290 RepID=UPI00214B1E51|nr:MULTISPECIES: ABC transporter permease [unclassified Microbacterium]MCR2811269.1 ABC transporter permease [Microbacterium sp. zg.B185]WIM19868.1 ABC transporter permease [Microbacterium sp. zg-B185]
MAFLKHLGKILFSSLILLGVVITILFLLLEIAPGDPIQTLVGDVPISEALRQQIYATFGLDKPLWERYFIYMGNVLTGNLGVSFGTEVPVTQLIGERIGNTLALAIPSFILSTIGAVIIGAIAAKTRKRWLDSLLSGSSVALFSLPNFWLGLMLIIVFSVTLGWLPVQGKAPYGVEGIEIQYMILPLITMVTAELAFKARIMRASMIESLGQDFMDTARSKGLSERQALRRHALPNALLPMVTVAGLSLAHILAGSVLVEKVFGWPGMGLLFIGAIERQDTFLVLGIVIVLTITILIVNIVTDVVYGLVDPRLRSQIKRPVRSES